MAPHKAMRAFMLTFFITASNVSPPTLSKYTSIPLGKCLHQHNRAFHSLISNLIKETSSYCRSSWVRSTVEFKVKGQECIEILSISLVQSRRQILLLPVVNGVIKAKLRLQQFHLHIIFSNKLSIIYQLLLPALYVTSTL
jgi:hypothetical protein